MAPGTPKGIITWDAFMARLDEVYWPSFDPAARLSSRPNPPANEPHVPDDLWRACYMIFPDPEAWLHNPVPQLGGKTPIEALGRNRLDDVKSCVMGVADFFLPHPSEVRPWSEVEAAYAEAEAEAEAEMRAAGGVSLSPDASGDASGDASRAAGSGDGDKND